MNNNNAPTIKTISIAELCRLAKPHPTVQRNIKPAAVTRLVESFESWLADNTFLALPMFFATESEHGGLILHDGQHRLEALNHLSLAYKEEFETSLVAVTVFPPSTPNALLKEHFNAVNSGMLVAKNLQASFSRSWDVVSMKFEPWQLSLIETVAGAYSATAYNAADMVRLVDVLDVGILEVIQQILNSLPDYMRRRSKSFREFAIFSSGFVNALLELPKYTEFGDLSELHEALKVCFADVPMQKWANNAPFPFFWVQGKTDIVMAGTSQSRKAWVAKLLEMLTLKGYGDNIHIPKKLDTICEFLPPESEVRLRQFVTEGGAKEKTEKQKEKEKTENATTPTPPKGKGKGGNQGKAKTTPTPPKEKGKGGNQGKANTTPAVNDVAKGNVIHHLEDDPTTVTI